MEMKLELFLKPTSSKFTHQSWTHRQHFIWR